MTRATRTNPATGAGTVEPSPINVLLRNQRVACELAEQLGRRTGEADEARDVAVLLFAAAQRLARAEGHAPVSERAIRDLAAHPAIDDVASAILDGRASTRWKR